MSAPSRFFIDWRQRRPGPSIRTLLGHALAERLRASRLSSPSTSTAKVLRLRRDRQRLLAAYHPRHPRRGRSARLDLPRRAGRRFQGDLCRLFFQRQQDRRLAPAGARCSRTTRSGSIRLRKLATQAREPVVHYEHSELSFNLPLEQPAGRPSDAHSWRPCATAQRRASSQDQRSATASCSRTPPASRSCPRAFYGCGNNLAELRVLVDLRRAFGADQRGGPLPSRFRGAPTSRVTGRCGSRCTCRSFYSHAAIYGGVAVSTALFERGLCLPSGSALTDEEQSLIVETMLTARC